MRSRKLAGYLGISLCALALSFNPRTAGAQSTAAQPPGPVTGSEDTEVPAQAPFADAERRGVGTSPADREKALEHFRLGNEAFASGDLLQAYTEYQAAWHLHEAFDIACNLGRTEAELNKARDAAQHLHYCLRNFSASTRPELRDAELKLEQLYERVRAQVAILRVVVDPEGAFISVDGKMLGKTPLSNALFVEPGKHVVQAQKVGFASVKREVVASAGQTREVRLQLFPQVDEKPQAPLGQEGPQPAPGASEPDVIKTIVLIAGGAVSVSFLAGGIAFWSDASSRQDDAAALRREIADETGLPNACYDDGHDSCGRLADTVDRMDRSRRLGTGSFIGGAVLGAATVGAYFLWPKRESRTSIVPSVAPGFAGIAVSGSL